MMRVWFYLGSCLLVVFAPGPDNCFVLAQSAAYGASAGLAVTAGLVSGLCVHITLAMLGVAAILQRWPRISDLISAFGACYLLWMAWGMWGGGLETQAALAQTSLWNFYLKGVILNLSNPKVILFFLAFIPRFLPDPCPHRAVSLCCLGGLFAVCAAFGMSVIALLGGTLSHYLQATSSAAEWLSRGAAVAVGAIGLWIAYELVRDWRRKRA